MARFPEVYADSRWPPARQAVIIRAKGLCEQCLKRKIYKSGREVDHIEELTEENKDDWNIAYNPDNLQYLCTDCHNNKHSRSIGIQDFITPVE